MLAGRAVHFWHYPSSIFLRILSRCRTTVIDAQACTPKHARSTSTPPNAKPNAKLSLPSQAMSCLRPTSGLLLDGRVMHEKQIGNLFGTLLGFPGCLGLSSSLELRGSLLCRFPAILDEGFTLQALMKLQLSHGGQGRDEACEPSSSRCR